MEKTQSASHELNSIAKSKRIPNAILLYGNGKHKLKSALDFCKTVLTLDEEGEKKSRLEKMCGSFTHPDLHFIFPIPSSGNIFLNSDIEFDAVIFNSVGEQVFKGKVKKHMDIRKLEKGIYFLHLFHGVNNSTHKIVKD